MIQRVPIMKFVKNFLAILAVLLAAKNSALISYGFDHIKPGLIGKRTNDSPHQLKFNHPLTAKEKRMVIKAIRKRLKRVNKRMQPFQATIAELLTKNEPIGINKGLVATFNGTCQDVHPLQAQGPDFNYPLNLIEQRLVIRKMQRQIKHRRLLAEINELLYSLSASDVPKSIRRVIFGQKTITYHECSSCKPNHNEDICRFHEDTVWNPIDQCNDDVPACGCTMVLKPEIKPTQQIIDELRKLCKIRNEYISTQKKINDKIQQANTLYYRDVDCSFRLEYPTIEKRIRYIAQLIAIIRDTHPRYKEVHPLTEIAVFYIKKLEEKITQIPHNQRRALLLRFLNTEINEHTWRSMYSVFKHLLTSKYMNNEAQQIIHALGSKARCRQCDNCKTFWDNMNRCNCTTMLHLLCKLSQEDTTPLCVDWTFRNPPYDF